MDLKLRSPNLIVEARAEFTLLKWPTESSPAVWKYTKQKGDVPGVEPVIPAQFSLFTLAFLLINTRLPQVAVAAHCSVCH